MTEDKKTTIRNGKLHVVEEKDLRSGDIVMSEHDVEKDVAISTQIPGTARLQIAVKGPIQRHLHLENGTFPIYQWVIMSNGDVYQFHRFGKMDKEGYINLDACDVGEVVIRPGGVYRKIQPQAKHQVYFRKYKEEVAKAERKQRLKNMGIVT